MKNIITVIYPDEFTASFVIKTDKATDHHDLLEMVFDQWNSGSPNECELFRNSNIRSLSVGDVVCINGRYHMCKSLGWKEITPEEVNELENAVSNHPNRINGSWFALNAVIREPRWAN